VEAQPLARLSYVAAGPTKEMGRELMAMLARVDAISDRTLSRLLTWGVVVLVVLLAAFSVVYYRGTHVNSGPSLPDRQVQSAEDLVRKSPQNINARLELANAYLKVSRPEDAITQYDEILKAVPGLQAAVYGKASASMTLGDLTTAKKLFGQVITTQKKGEFAAADPLLASAHYWLGKMAADASDWKTAATEIKASLAADDADADGWFLLGTVQTKAGDPKSAVASLSRAVAFVPTGWCEPYGALVDAYTALKQPEMATYAGAMSVFCKGDAGGAVGQLEALTSGAAKVPAMLALGLIAETQSDRTVAQGWYEKALKADPANATAKTALARLSSGTTDGSASAAPQAKAK
jgi:tetratricopeptide (TPR) repeat protein